VARPSGSVEKQRYHSPVRRTARVGFLSDEKQHPRDFVPQAQLRNPLTLNPMARPLIALLTDFGLRDHYVGTMKGVMLGICPEASLVDISHDVAPQDVLGAALELASAYSYFPPGTIFLVVVDPGV